MSICSTEDLFSSTKPIYTFQPLLADRNSFKTASTLFAALNLLLGIYIVVANLVVVGFYRGKLEQVVPLLYSFIASNDIVTGFLVFARLIFLEISLLGVTG